MHFSFKINLSAFAQINRKLIDPSKKAKTGDIRIIEADINSIEFTDMKLGKNRNDYLRTWMVNMGKGHMNALGDFVPSDDNPIGRPNKRGTFTIKKQWYFTRSPSAKWKLYPILVKFHSMCTKDGSSNDLENLEVLQSLF